MRRIDKLRKAGAPIHGIGVQLNADFLPSSSLLIHRLQRLAEAQLPIWITSYKYSNNDTNTRAQTFSDFLDLVMGFVSTCRTLYLTCHISSHYQSDLNHLLLVY